MLLNRWVSRGLKAGSDVADLTSGGSLFQTEAAATTKARSPMEERRLAVRASKVDAAQRRCFRRVHRPRVARQMTSIWEHPTDALEHQCRQFISTGNPIRRRVDQPANHHARPVWRFIDNYRKHASISDSNCLPIFKTFSINTSLLLWKTLKALTVNIQNVIDVIKYMVLIFTALHGMQTRYSDENSVCLSVRPSVCLSHAWSLTKWKKDRSRFLYHTKEHLA